MSQGLIKVKSANDFATTYSKLRKILADNPAIGIVAELDHRNNAAKAGLDLGNARIIMFGNPLLGTPLMQSNIDIAIDLPQKFIVFEQKGTVYIGYNDPSYLKERHGIEGKEEVFEKISAALNKISGLAAS